MTNDEIAALVDAFEACTLPLSEWTHAGHLTVTVWYLMRYGAEQGGERMRAGIQRYVAAQRIAPRPDGGYHETLTRFYLWAVTRYLHDAVAELATGCVACLDDRGIPLQYYSRDRLMSPEARRAWVEPDLRPLV